MPLRITLCDTTVNTVIWHRQLEARIQEAIGASTNPQYTAALELLRNTKTSAKPRGSGPSAKPRGSGPSAKPRKRASIAEFIGSNSGGYGYGYGYVY